MERLVLSDHLPLPTLEEISPLPGRIGELQTEKQAKISVYRQCVAEFGDFIENDLGRAMECQDEAMKVEQEIMGLQGEIDQLCTELAGLVSEKLTEARILRKRMNGRRSPTLDEAVDLMEQVQEHQSQKDFTAALLKAEQALMLLGGYAREQLRASFAHHQGMLGSL